MGSGGFIKTYKYTMRSAGQSGCWKRNKFRLKSKNRWSWVLMDLLQLIDRLHRCRWRLEDLESSSADQQEYWYWVLAVKAARVAKELAEEVAVDTLPD